MCLNKGLQWSPQWLHRVDGANLKLHTVTYTAQDTMSGRVLKDDQKRRVQDGLEKWNNLHDQNQSVTT